MKIFKMGFILAVFCVIAAGLLAYVYLFTKPTIEAQEKMTFENSKREVLAGADGYVVSVSPRGYAGEIKILAGVDLDGRIKGVKILDHRETAGLGANVVSPAFLKQFLEKTVKDPLEPKKDIDAVTGATISSRAVCKGVKEALEKVKL